MANQIILGRGDAGPLKLDVARLVKTRLLVTANSGGGKSWLLRLLFEQVGRSTQLLVLDREGEFVTLREKLDIVLVGPQGEIPADVRSAAVIGRLQKLLGEGSESSPNAQPAESPTPTPHHRAPKNPIHFDMPARDALSATERAVLDAAASFPGGATKQRIAIYSGRSIKSSTFDMVFAGGECKDGKRPSLVQAGLLRKEGEKYAPTETGAALAVAVTGTSLNDWVGKLKPSEGKVLKCLASAYPQRLKRGEVAERIGQSAKSSTFDSAFPALRDLGLIEGKEDYAIVPELAGGES